MATGPEVLERDMLRERLNPGGAVSFWSAAAAPVLAERLTHHFRAVQAIAVTVPHAEPDYIYVAVK